MTLQSINSRILVALPSSKRRLAAMSPWSSCCWRAGRTPYLSNWYGDALRCAAESRRTDTIRELILWGMDPRRLEASGRSYISSTVDLDSWEALETLVDLGASIDIRVSALGLHSDTKVKLPFFHYACRCACEKIVATMLRRGWADANMRCSGGWTGLHFAAETHDLATIKTLLEAGADVNAVDDAGHTPLSVARLTDSPAVMKVLLDAGAGAGAGPRSQSI